jgi:hypothetical protein
MKASDKTFPHNTTLNQFFDEKKFEAYRALGQHMMEFILQSGNDKIPTMPLDIAHGDTAASRVHRLFDKLYAQI